MAESEFEFEFEFELDPSVASVYPMLSWKLLSASNSSSLSR